MQITDTIADLFAVLGNRKALDITFVNKNLANSLLHVRSRDVNSVMLRRLSVAVTEDGKQGVITVTLKYVEGGVPAIKGLKRVSKPGLRIYSNAAELPKVMKGLGTAVISTSKGVMTDREARKMNIGGEVLAFIW